MNAQSARGDSQDRRGPYHHGNLRAALVDAAVGILAAEGLDALGLRAAARAAGVSAAAPSHHFKNKEGLLAAVSAEGFRRLAAHQAGVPAAGADVAALLARVTALGRSYIAFARESPELYRLMFGRGIENRSEYPELMEAIEASYSVIEEATHAYLAVAGPGAVAPKVAINGAWSVVHGLASLLNDGKVMPGQLGNPAEDVLVGSILELWARGLARGLGDPEDD